MQLALRMDAPTNATLPQLISCFAIKARLVSHYCHGGIVIDGRLYHATSARGLHVLDANKWSPTKWVLVDIGTERDTQALELFQRFEGADYDWFSLLAFVGLPIRDQNRFYCFEWCWLAMTGEHPTARVTPEQLLLLSKTGIKGYEEFTRLSCGLPVVASMAD